MRSKICAHHIYRALVLAAAACSSGVQVRTSVAPDESLAGLHTFSGWLRQSGALLRHTRTDPMLNNSITNHSCERPRSWARRKGYAVASSNPDFQVAYYAGTKQKLDTTYWNRARRIVRVP